MAVSYEFSPADQLCVWTMSGRLTVDAMLEAVLAARADPAWSNEYDFLTIFVDASLSDVTPDDASALIESFATLDTPRADGLRKRAGIVCTDEMAAGLLTYYEMKSDSERASIERYFPTEREARAWLASPRGA
ncbi:hypothetical protein [Maricaulis sp.]|uniref:hypothetical protein n=1 Tax=Maricaulis sp. TaxID=1486257 RepID=UPI003A931CAD